MAVLILSPSIEPDRQLLGGKAAGVVRMVQLGVPVPPAFAITTDECQRFQTSGAVPEDVLSALPGAMHALEQQTGMTFGQGPRPLLVAVRSGAPISMPGMMDTVLNLGMTAEVQASLASLTGNAVFAADVSHRFFEQFCHIVGVDAPHDPWEQLHAAVAAVFASWGSERAVAYRKDRALPAAGGTAVTIQAMVFGNLDDQSGTGVLFSRNPMTGTPEPYGEWLARGQGEDIVSGRRDPMPLDALSHKLPEVHRDLLTQAAKLERVLRDVQDIEFTVQSGKLWLLQTRAAKRSATAAVRLAVWLRKAGIISIAEAVERVTPAQIAAMRRWHVEPTARATATVLASGRPASPGVVTGIAVLDHDEAEERASRGEDIIFVRQTTNPDDVRAMIVVKGIVTEVGGGTSHAAVVSRELGVACVVGCGLKTVTSLVGRELTLDADSGELLDGILPICRLSESEDLDLATLRQWAKLEGRNERTT